MLLTDELLLHGQRCQRRAFLELYGDRHHKKTSSDYLSKIIKDSESYRYTVLQTFHGIKPQGRSESWEDQVQATVQLMAQGVPAIVQGHLARPDPELGSTLMHLAKPDLLLKRPGLSRFGNWCYVPVLVKLGRRPKLEYQLLALFQSFVLAEVQGLWPAQAGLILRSPQTYPIHPYWVSLRERLAAFQELLTACKTTLSQPDVPEVFIARNRCSLCLWLDYCSQEARSSRHLSLLPGITPKRYGVLKSLGIRDLETLAATSPSTLEPLPGFGASLTQQLLQQARSTLNQQPLLHAPPKYLLPLEDPVEFYFDIESQPDLDLIYLHGVLMVQGQEQRFYPFLAEQPDQEAMAWNQFLDLVTAYPQAPIYHFCPYEVDSIRRLGKAYRTPSRVIDRLAKRCVDLHAWVTNTVTLPVESYALKPIAQWLGFQWRQEDVNGAQAICWYNNWLTRGDRRDLERILIYNEDDCRATHRLKTWLAQFLHNTQTTQTSAPRIAHTPSHPRKRERSA